MLVDNMDNTDKMRRINQFKTVDNVDKNVDKLLITFFYKVKLKNN